MIRITSAPPGEAPLWVRESWVGLVLPAYGHGSPFTYSTIGVISGPKSFLGAFWALLLWDTKKTSGYAVKSRTALAALEAVNPQAVAWWRENAPHYFRARRLFVFHESTCTPVS